jgi:undecaprenyl-diphosphatase
LGALSIVSAALFYKLALLVDGKASLVQDINIPIQNLVQSFVTPGAIPFWKGVTALGGMEFLGTAVTLLVLYLIYKRTYREAIFYAGGMSLALIIVAGVKYITNSSRPVLPFAVEQTLSFPSGHTAITAIFLMQILYIHAKRTKLRLKDSIIFLSFIYSFVIAFSRLYLGEHWFLDIVGGYLLAISLGSLLIMIDLRLKKR